MMPISFAPSRQYTSRGSIPALAARIASGSSGNSLSTSLPQRPLRGLRRGSGCASLDPGSLPQRPLRGLRRRLQRNAKTPMNFASAPAARIASHIGFNKSKIKDFASAPAARIASCSTATLILVWPFASAPAARIASGRGALNQRPHTSKHWALPQRPLRGLRRQNCTKEDAICCT